MTKGSYRTSGGRSSQEKRMMNLPVHLGMDSRVGDTGPVLCHHGGVNISSFILSVGIHPQLVFIPSSILGQRNIFLRDNPFL